MYSLVSERCHRCSASDARVFLLSLSLDDERKKNRERGRRVCVENALYYDANWRKTFSGNEQLSLANSLVS